MTISFVRYRYQLITTATFLMLWLLGLSLVKCHFGTIRDYGLTFGLTWFGNMSDVWGNIIEVYMFGLMFATAAFIIGHILVSMTVLAERYSSGKRSVSFFTYLGYTTIAAFVLGVIIFFCIEFF